MAFVDAIRSRVDRIVARDLFSVGESTDDREAGKAIMERRMCSHVAWALLVHTVLVVLLIGHNISTHKNGMLGQMIVIAMIALFVLIARHFHYRWRIREAKQRSPESARVVTRFQRDLALLWTLTIGLPFLWLAIS